MGTSKGYLPPKGFLWKDTKLAVTNMCKNNYSSESIGNALSNYVQARTSGNGSSGSESNTNQSKSASKSVSKALNFISSFNENGLNGALENLGISVLIGKSSEEIYNGLIDYFAPDSNTIEDTISRECMTEILDDFKIVNLEEDFKPISGEDFFMNFMVKYVQKSFISNFFEKIQGLCTNIEGTNSAIKEIKNYIRVTLETDFTVEQLLSIDLTSNQGEQFISGKCEDAFDVFRILR
jgi:hypothetical protein